MSHIDWVFCSTDFDSHYSLASARTIPRTPSDHTPILWDSGTDIGIRKPRFKLEKWWIKHKEFRRLVHQIWTSPHVGMSAIDRWQTRIRALRRKAKGWSCNVEASIKKEKRKLEAKHEKVDIVAKSRVLIVQEKDSLKHITHRLNNIWDMEEVKARQRVREINIKEGDRNTRYFHVVANQRKRKTTIHSLDGSVGTMNKVEGILEVATQYYREPFKYEDRPNMNIAGGSSLRGKR
jgi:hypothetical protein